MCYNPCPIKEVIMEFVVAEAKGSDAIEKELAERYAEGWTLLWAYYQPAHGPKHILIFQRA